MRYCFLKITTLCVFASATLAHAQLFGSGIVFDPTQSAHAIEQIRQAQQLFTTTERMANNAIATYNLAHRMAMVPQSLYQPLLSPGTYWRALNRAANTYGNSQEWTASMNTGVGADAAYQRASVPMTGGISGYSNLSPAAQQEIAAQGATADLDASVTVSNMQTLGTIRANAERRQSDINALVQATQSMDPAEHTEMATLQRINRALVLLLEEQQEANQISQAYALQQIVTEKQKQDALRMTFQQANRFATGYDRVAPSYADAAAAMRY